MIDLPIVLPLLSLVVLWLLAGQVFALAYPIFSRFTCNLAPQLRSGIQFFYALMPVLIAGSIAILVFTPMLGGFYLADHCHGIQCASHVPVLQSGHAGGRIITVAVLGLVAGCLTMLVFMLWRNHRVVRVLARLSHKRQNRPYRILDTDDIVACCIGTLRQEVLISRGIIDRARPEQLAIIIGHELAHACRLDNLRRLVVSVATLSWPRSLQSGLLDDLETSAEQSCDQHIARLTGEPGQVASTIRKVEDWCQQLSGGQGYSPLCLQRTGLLLDRCDVIEGWKPAAMVLAASMVIILLGGDAMHRSVEAFLSVVPY